ncbi:alkylhydroperoxidase domain protein [Ruania albidiflava]|uniref:alkylhydroperoxidase domain protein n=1 Tax=Ruania albidiflava TaxID=366586 RepID=UPI0023F02C0D|nr:alkylhydroperoxidase domain protein [Ruania albidiflava]
MTTVHPAPAAPGPGPDAPDLVDALLHIAPGDHLDALRRARPAQREHTQKAYQALVWPVDEAEAGRTERLVLAWYVAELHRHTGLAAHYRSLLAGAADDGAAPSGASLPRAVAELVRVSAGSGPYGQYREPELAGESTEGLRLQIAADLGGGPAELLGSRLTAALEHAHLLTFRPRESSADAVQRLLDAGWSATGIVTISQLVAFLSYQVRVVHALAVLAGNTDQQAGAAIPAEPPAVVGTGHDAPAGARAGAAPAGAPGGAAAGGALRVRTYPDLDRPTGFTQEALGWVPWLEPLAESELTERHYEGLAQRARGANPYFALLARDPEVLGARTRADLDIFTNTDGGLGRAERELAATATSRVNGCVYCAHVHARAATRESGRAQDVQRLLDGGVDARIDATWDPVIDASAALAVTPPVLTAEHVAALRHTGLDDQAVADALSSAAFFSWANRLMLSLGEPRVPRRR